MNKTLLFLLSLAIVLPLFSMESLSPLNSDNLAFTSLQDFIQTKTALLKEKQNLAYDLIDAQKLNLPQTTTHLLFGYNTHIKILKTSIKYILRHARQMHYDTLDSILKKEQEMHTKGYYIFYHCTEPLFYTMHYIDTQLLLLEQEILHNVTIPALNILKLRQGPSSVADDLHAQTRMHFINNGTQDNHIDQEFLLSCNFALTSNLDRLTSCSLDFWVASSNMWPPQINPASIIKTYSDTLQQSINCHYVDFKNAIDTFISQCKSGVLLQLIFKSPTLIEDCVYPSYPFGRKRSVLINENEITNPVAILDALQQNPECIKEDVDYLQFRVVLTKDKLLDVINPDIYDNFEIYAYAAPMNALEVFKQNVDTVITEIRTELSFIPPTLI